MPYAIAIDVLRAPLLTCYSPVAAGLEMPAKKKSKRGSNLPAVRRTKLRPDADASVAQSNADSDDADDDYEPDRQADDDNLVLDDAAGLIPEPREPGARRSAAREAAAAAVGARETRRIDDQANRQRLCRQRQKDLDAMPSIQDAFDGTLMAKKLAQELEPADSWAEPPIAVAEPVATDADGERLVILGAAGAEQSDVAAAAGSKGADREQPAAVTDDCSRYNF